MHAIVAGAVANKPRNGGEAWVRVSWALGLARLGFEVHLIEAIREAICVDRQGAPCSVEDSVNLEHFLAVTRHFALDATLLCDGATVSGRPVQELIPLVDESAVLIDISGHLHDVRLGARSRRQVYVDLDPGFTQAWIADGLLRLAPDDYDLFATVGERIGQRNCPVPSAGIQWAPTRQPVVLCEWPVVTAEPERGFATVARWRAPHGAVDIGGTTHTLKHHEFRRFIDLPHVCRQEFEVALDVDPQDERDRNDLVRHGWRVVNATSVAATPSGFRDYVRASSAEFSPCQGVYAATACGWLSDRTTRFLACGRPAVVQETNVAIPTGEGLLTFRTRDEAAERVAAVVDEYAHHARAARALAETHLDSDRVVGDLLARAGVGG